MLAACRGTALEANQKSFVSLANSSIANGGHRSYSVNLGGLARQTAIRLSRCFRSAQASTVEPRPVEAANAALPGGEHGAGIFDPARARLWLFGGRDPLDPIPAR